MKANNLPIIIIDDCKTNTDILRKLKLPENGKSLKIVKEYIKLHNLDISHFEKYKSQTKYEKITKNCPVCTKEFEALKGHIKEKTVCSKGCSNTYFRSGENNANYKSDENSGYRKLCFKYHKKECIICKETNIVAVHHFDENHKNNEISNLIPMCPTHHQYMHSSFKHLIEAQVIAYKNSFQKK